MGRAPRNESMLFGDRFTESLWVSLYNAVRQGVKPKLREPVAIQ